MASLTSRQVPLCSEAVTALLTLVNNSYTSYIQKTAGITSANSCAYQYRLMELFGEGNFIADASAITIPQNLLTFIEGNYFNLNNPESFTENMITQIFNCLEMTNEFSGFITSLQGMTPENCQDYQYRSVIQFEIMLCPKFLIDAETFPLET